MLKEEYHGWCNSRSKLNYNAQRNKDIVNINILDGEKETIYKNSYPPYKGFILNLYR